MHLASLRPHKESTLSHDIIIIGAGVNGLAAGLVLARSGRKVLILEAQDEPGGAVRTGEVTLAGFRHDLYATNLSGFQGSALYQAFGADLIRHGLDFIRADKAFCSVFPNGDFIDVSTSIEETLAGLRRISARDADTWLRLLAQFKRHGPAILDLLRQPMPSRAMLQLPFYALRLAVQSSGAFVRSHFENENIRAFWAAWGLHLDFPPEIRGGAVYPFLQCMQTQTRGLSFGRGGANNLIMALAGAFKEQGGELRLSAPVSEVVVENGVAIGVVSGEDRFEARQAVVGNLAPTVLARLVRAKLLPRNYRYGPGTMMIHLALSDVPEWRDERARDYAYIHIAPSLAAMSAAYDDARKGVTPAEPLLIIAQPTVIDPSRAPPGRHILSIQVRVVPTTLDKHRYADHVIDIIERYAPGLRQIILGQHVIGPDDLERANANLVGGDSLGGSHHLSQQFVFRPFLGWSRYRTPIRGLFLCGASTWPGAGVGASSGWLLGQMLAAA